MARRRGLESQIAFGHRLIWRPTWLLWSPQGLVANEITEVRLGPHGGEPTYQAEIFIPQALPTCF